MASDYRVTSPLWVFSSADLVLLLCLAPLPLTECGKEISEVDSGIHSF